MQCGRDLRNFVFEHDASKDALTERDRRKIREKFPEDRYILVQHKTKKTWREHFKQRGIDTTVSPPDMYYGRLTKYGQAKIREAGLYVEPPGKLDSGVLIAVKPSELAISYESADKGCETPECALYYWRDAIIKGTHIPPERVLGSFDYRLKPKKRRETEQYDSEWMFRENEAARNDKEMRRILRCIDYPPLRWCKCDGK